tara:strand:+ start:1540 stop:1737 length:198 start_codon:yes stop_codon:yes gene_type:complete
MSSLTEKRDACKQELQQIADEYNAKSSELNQLGDKFKEKKGSYDTLENLVAEEAANGTEACEVAN